MVAMHNALFAQYGSAMLIGAYAILGYIVTVYYLIAEARIRECYPGCGGNELRAESFRFPPNPMTVRSVAAPNPRNSNGARIFRP